MNENVRSQIVELLNRSAYALDHKDLDALQASFTEDARFQPAQFP